MSITLKDGTVLPDIPTEYVNLKDVGLPDIATLKYHMVVETNDGYALVATDFPFATADLGVYYTMMPVASESLMVGMFSATCVVWMHSATGWTEYKTSSAPLFGNDSIVMMQRTKQSEEGDVWIAIVNGALAATCCLVWSDYTIANAEYADEDTGDVHLWADEPYHRSDVPHTFTLSDGTELPALPDGCFDGTPYGFIMYLNDTAFGLYVVEKPLTIIPGDVLGDPDEWLLMPIGLVRCYMWYEDLEDWMLVIEDKIVDSVPSSLDGYTLRWSNHDIMNVRSVNDDGSFVIGSKIAHKSDVNYRVTSGYMRSILNEIRRLTGSTKRMKPAVIEDTLRRMFFCAITCVADPGVTITATYGDKTYTGMTDETGHITFGVYNEGDYTITASFYDALVGDPVIVSIVAGYNTCEIPTLFASPVIVPWSTGTDAQIAAMVKALDAGHITVADTGWSVGDERVVTLSAMPITGDIKESHAEQTATLVIMDKQHYTLTEPTPCGDTLNHFVVGLKDGLNEMGIMNSIGAAGGWKGSDRREWCNSTFRAALPEAIRGAFKQFKVTACEDSSPVLMATTDDYFALFAEKEVTGGYTYSANVEANELTQIEWYKTTANRAKLAGGALHGWWLRSRATSPNSTRFCHINTSGKSSYANPLSEGGIAPFGCI